MRATSRPSRAATIVTMLAAAAVAIAAPVPAAQAGDPGAVPGVSLNYVLNGGSITYSGCDYVGATVDFRRTIVHPGDSGPTVAYVGLREYDLCAGEIRVQAEGRLENAELVVRPNATFATARGDAVLENPDASPVVVHVDLTFVPSTVGNWGGPPSAGWVHLAEAAGTITGSITANGDDLLQPGTGAMLDSWLVT